MHVKIWVFNQEYPRKSPAVKWRMGCQTHWHDLWRAIDKADQFHLCDSLSLALQRPATPIESKCLRINASKPGLIKFQNDLCNQGQDGNQVWFQFLWTHWSFIFHSWVPSTILFDTCVCCVLATGTGQCRHSTHFTPAWCSEVQLQLLFFYTKASNVSEGAVALSEIWTRTVHWGCALSANKFHPYCAILDTRKKWAQLNTDWIDL